MDNSDLLKTLWKLRFLILTNMDFDVDDKEVICDAVTYDVAKDLFEKLCRSGQTRFADMDFREFCKYTLRNFELAVYGRHKIIKRKTRGIVTYRRGDEYGY
ncbi:MAG: hypothetical protein QXS37_06775 [Candidatus Aenigmatarchaeota archaeon]